MFELSKTWQAIVKNFLPFCEPIPDAKLRFRYDVL